MTNTKHMHCRQLRKHIGDLRKGTARAGGVAQLVGCLPDVREALGSIPAPVKQGEVVHTCNPRSWKVQAGKSGRQDPPWLHSRSEASLGSMRQCHKKKK